MAGYKVYYHVQITCEMFTELYEAHCSCWMTQPPYLCVHIANILDKNWNMYMGRVMGIYQTPMNIPVATSNSSPTVPNMKKLSPELFEPLPPHKLRDESELEKEIKAQRPEYRKRIFEPKRRYRDDKTRMEWLQCYPDFSKDLPELHTQTQQPELIPTSNS